MSLDTFFLSVQNSPIGVTIREEGFWFPWIECVHVLALTQVVGSIAIVDLRLLGVASLNRSVSRLSDEVLPWTWAAFAIAAISGVLLFSSNALTYWHNLYFQLKIAFLILVGLNMLAYQFIFSRGVEEWGKGPVTPLRAKLAGLVSLTLWIAIIGFGRWIGFTFVPLS